MNTIEYAPRYSQTTKRIHFSLSVGSLSSRDKVTLFQALMDDLGITEVLHANGDETAKAQELMAKQWDIAWDRKE